MHVSIGATLVALVAGAALPSAAAAQARCTAPDEPGWRSCLTTVHKSADEGVRLTKVRPRLVIRSEQACPKGADRRTVVIRTGGGTRLGQATVRSSCRRGVARWTASLRLDVDLPEGTVVRSFWGRIADRESAPAVELDG